MDKSIELTKNFIKQYRLRHPKEQPDTGWTPEIALAFEPDRPFDTDIRIGDIRNLVLWPESVSVLVLHKWDEGAWLVVPMSRYDYPATEEEVMLYAECPPVLQVWNTGTLCRDFLERSWLVGGAPHGDFLQKLWDIYRYQQWSGLGFKEPEYKFEGRCGIPIKGAADIRHEYMAEENASMWGVAMCLEDAIEENAKESKNA